MKRIATYALAAALTLGFAATTYTIAQEADNNGAAVEKAEKSKRDGFHKKRRGHHKGHDFIGFAKKKGHRELHAFWNNEELVEAVGLSEEQIDALQESLDLALGNIEDTAGSIREAHEALRDELQKDAPDLETVNDLADDLADAINEKHKFVLAHKVTVKNVLTEEQEQALREYRREQRPRHHKRWDDDRRREKLRDKDGPREPESPASPPAP